MIYHRENFSHSRGLPEVQAGDVFVECNFAQAAPGTRILEGVKGLVFQRCNLARAVVPDGSKVEGCNTSQEPLPADEPTVRVHKIEGPMLKSLVDNAEKGGMDVTDIRRKYDLAAVAMPLGGEV